MRVGRQLLPACAAISALFSTWPAAAEPPPVWAEQAELTPGIADIQFGCAAAIDGDTAVVGACMEDHEYFTGSVYVYVRSNGVWTQQAKLLPADVPMGKAFGIPIAISGDIIAVGSVWGVGGPGAIYMFVRTGTSWHHEAKVTLFNEPNDAFFGSAVAVSGNTLLAGVLGDDDNGFASGAAYAFVRTGTDWVQQAKLVAEDGDDYDRFGWSVALDGDTALIGAASDGQIAEEAGSAYVFARSGTTWSQQAKLLPASGSDPTPEWNRFGRSVALHGDTALIGAPLDDYGTNAPHGSAYVFTRSAGAWAQQAKLLAPEGDWVEEFGTAIGLSGDTAIVGSPRYHGVEPDAMGAAYLFNRAGDAWGQQAKLVPPPSAYGKEFGYGVGVSGTTVLVSAIASTALAGSAHVFGFGSPSGEPCAASDDCASGHCVDGVCCATACGGGDPDDCQACSVAGGALEDGACAPLGGPLCDVSCAGGVCSGDAGADAGDAGAGPPDNDSIEFGGCGCLVGSTRARGASLLAALALIALRRRRPR